MSLNKNYFEAYFLFFFTALSFSQQLPEKHPDSLEIETLKEVLITATRTKRQLSAVPLPAKIISQKEIQAINAIRLSDILEEQTGLITVPDFGGGEGIQMQGLDAQYTLILIDGVPMVGRLAGTFDLNRLSVGNIKQIEIVKGASSSLYGNEALGGVINIITEKAKPGFKGDMRYRGGTFNSHDLNTNINYKGESLGLTAFINRNSSDGYRLAENSLGNTVDPFVNYTVSSNLSYEFSEDTQVIVQGRFYNQIQDIVLSEEFSGENEINEWNLNIRAEHSFNERWSGYLELYGTQYKAEEIFTSEISEDTSASDFDQHFLRPEFRTTYALNDDHEFIGGLGLTNERLQRTLFSSTPEFNAPYIYVQYDGKLNANLSTILGARFDAHNAYQSQFSPKAAIRYEISRNTMVKASVGYGFKAPDFRQLFLDFTNSTAGGYTVLGYNVIPTRLQELYEQDLLNIDSELYPTPSDQQAYVNTIIERFNSDLLPESSVSLNFGVDLKPAETLSLNINVFRNNITNLIETLAIAQRENGQNVFSYQNLAEVNTQGIEVDARWNVNDNFSISGGYQLLYAFDRSAQDAFDNGEVFARDPLTLNTFRLQSDDYFGLFNRSRHMANLRLFYKLPNWGLNTSLRGTYRSKYGLFDSNGNTYLDRFDQFVEANTIWDVALNKTFFENYQIGIGVDNLFDFTDTQITNVPGRLYYATLNINF